MKLLPSWLDFFSTVPSKATPVAADHVLLDDSAASFAKKYATVGSLKTALLDSAGPSLCFGASMGDGDVNKYFQPHGIANGGKFNTLTEESETACPVTGTAAALAWRSAGVLSGAQVDVIVNGISAATLTLNGSNGVVTSSISVTAGDRIALQYITKGTTTMGKSVYELFIKGV